MCFDFISSETMEMSASDFPQIANITYREAGLQYTAPQIDIDTFSWDQPLQDTESYKDVGTQLCSSKIRQGTTH